MSKSSRRVLAVIRHPVGGIRTYILYHYPYLIEKGFRFTFVGPNNDDFQSFQQDVRDWPGVDFYSEPVINRKCRLRKTVRRVLKNERIDLIHSHGLTAGVESIIGCIGKKTPHILTSHDSLPKELFKGLKGNLKRLLLNLMLKRVTRVIAVSNDALDSHAFHFPALAKRSNGIQCIRNGILISRFISEDSLQKRERLRSQIGVSEDQILLGYLGRFMPEKGFGVLLDALCILKEDSNLEHQFHLLAVGSGDYVREYTSEVNDRGLESFITFHPVVSDISCILPGIDLLVTPSFREACPLLPMEAMISGIPVLGSDCIGQREVLYNTPSRTVLTGDAKSLAEGLKKAINSLWTDEAQKFTEEARERFSAERASAHLMCLFDEVTSKQ